MSEELERFVSQIPNFDAINPSKKIDFFLYFLTINKSQEGVVPKDISSCFNELHISPYSNIPSYLAKNSIGKNKKYLKKKGKYFLERTNSSNIKEILGEISVKEYKESSYIPLEIFGNTRQYLELIAKQAIASYETGIYDACNVLSRKLIEILIIECFERHRIDSNIKRDDGVFFFLSDLITALLKEKKWNLTRNAQKSLPKVKELGDLSAHNRRFVARKGDIDKVSNDIRIVVEELIHLIDYPNWK